MSHDATSATSLGDSIAAFTAGIAKHAPPEVIANRVAREYGLVFSLSEAMRGLQTGFGNPIPKFNGDDSWELPMPGTFVLDRGGVVRLAHVDPDYMKRLEPAAILESLRAVRS